MERLQAFSRICGRVTMMSLDARSILLRFTSGTSLRARLARATVWILVGSVLQQGFAMLGGIASARMLGTTQFGELGVVRSTTVVFVTLTGSGLGLAATRYVSALRIEDPLRAGRVIGLLLRIALTVSIAAAVIMAALAEPIAAYIVGAPQLALPIAISAIGVVAVIVGSVQQGVITGCEAFRASAAWTAADGIASSTLMVVGAWSGGVTGATIGFVSGLTGVLLLRHYSMRRECRRAAIPLHDAGWRTERRIIGEFVLPSVLVGIATQPAEWLGRVMLARGPDGLTQVGLFTAAYSWAQLVLFLPTQIAAPAMPMLSGLYAAGDRASFRRLLRESALATAVIAVAVALPVALLAPWIMRAYGSDFAGGAAVLAVFAVAYAIGSVTIVFRITLLAVGKAWLQNAYSLVWGVALFVAFLLLRDRGAVGLSWSYTVAFGALVVVQLAAILRYVRWRA